MKGIIIYASKYGCTEKAAKLLQSKLPGDIKIVNIERDNTPDLSFCDTVILGGPIYVGKLHSALTAYIKQNSTVLKKKELGIFICAGEQDSAVKEKLLVSAFSEELYYLAKAKEVFGGELHLDKVGLPTKLILRIVKGIKEDYSRLSEAKIDRFAKELIKVQG